MNDYQYSWEESHKSSNQQTGLSSGCVTLMDLSDKQQSTHLT